MIIYLLLFIKNQNDDDFCSNKKVYPTSTSFFFGRRERSTEFHARNKWDNRVTIVGHILLAKY